jgi:S-adenosylmethionine synthetase
MSICNGLFSSGSVSESHPDKLVDRISDALRREFDLTPAGIVRCLELQRAIYYPTAAYEHFGRDDLDLPSENNATWGARS